MPDRDVARRVLRALNQSLVGGTTALVGSSGLFGFDTGLTQLGALLDQVERRT